MKGTKIVALFGAAAIAVVIVALALRSKRSPEVEPAEPPAETAPQEVARPAPAAPSPPQRARTVEPRPAVAPPARRSPPPVEAMAPPARSEASLMEQLRDLGGSNPELSLRLAREGIEQFKESADAPERSWIVVKSLMNLQRIDEARAEARLLLDKYPHTSFAEDVHRHMFVNPPTHPEERGYGKKNELE